MLSTDHDIGPPNRKVEHDRALAEHATEIRRLGKRAADDIIEIGRRLAECRHILKEDGSWRVWLDQELRLSPQSAGRFIQVYEQRSNLEHLELSVSTLYLLAAPSTPDEARNEIIERVETGEPVSVAEAKRVIEDAKGRSQPWRKPRRPPNPVRAMNLRKMKLGDETVGKLKGTSLDSAAELDELVVLNRGAPQGGHTEIVDQLVADAVAGKQVSAIECTKNGTAFRRDYIGSTSGQEAEIERLRVRNAELENEKCRLEIKVQALESEVEELRAAAKPIPETASSCSICREKRPAMQRQVFACDRCVEIHDLDGLDIPAWMRRSAS
jgi:Protein of unknown function (DUF3102)